MGGDAESSYRTEPFTTACDAMGSGYGGLLLWCIIPTPDHAKETRMAPTKIAGIQERFMFLSSSGFPEFWLKLTDLSLPL
jgi:hypothetical protein